VLVELSVGNAAMAAGALAWLITDTGFSTAGLTILGTFVAWKAAISMLQLRSLRHARPVDA
jgi:hypothetical protein